MVERWTFNPQALGSNPCTLIFIFHMFILINIKSNNIKSLKNCIAFLKRIILKTSVITVKQQNKIRKKKTFSVLRSPHVNSKSGEHFMYNTYQINIKLIVKDLKTFSFIFKKIKRNLHTDCVFTAKRLFNKFSLKKKYGGTFDPDKFVVLENSILTSFKSWDSFGEACFNSSLKDLD